MKILHRLKVFIFDGVKIETYYDTEAELYDAIREQQAVKTPFNFEIDRVKINDVKEK